MELMTERIIREAINLLNEKGMKYFSMREIAKKLNIKASSLYYHVRNKREIYSLLSEHVCGKLNIPPEIPAGPEEAENFLLESGKKLRTELLKIRDSAIIFGETVPNTPKHLDFTKGTVEAFSRLGLNEAYCFFAANTFINYVLFFLMDEAYFKSIPRGKPKYPGTEFYKKYVTGMDYDRQFLFGLEALIEGIRRKARGS